MERKFGFSDVFVWALAVAFFMSILVIANSWSAEPKTSECFHEIAQKTSITDYAISFDKRTFTIKVEKKKKEFIVKLLITDQHKSSSAFNAVTILRTPNKQIANCVAVYAIQRLIARQVEHQVYNTFNHIYDGN